MNNDAPQAAWRDLRHTCSYHCHKPDCIRAQRDYLRDKMEDTESNEELKRQNKKLIDTLHDAKALLLFWIERNGYNANDFDDTLTMRDINKLLAGVNEET